ncbi:hypothetical protein, partial [Eubacterium aggregans]|uniref:hypothetical protein n=1 Tax=Eubacterium aggregans TaxID=81409 RepID=UPI003F408F47
MTHSGLEMLDQIENIFYLNVGFEVLSIFVTFCLLFGSILARCRTIKINKYYVLMQIVHLSTLVLDIILIIRSENTDYYIITRRRSFLATISESAVIILSEFSIIRVFCQSKRRSRIVPLFSGCVTTVTIIIWIVNTFLSKYAYFKFFDDGININMALFGVNQLVLSLILIGSIFFIGQ